MKTVNKAKLNSIPIETALGWFGINATAGRFFCCPCHPDNHPSAMIDKSKRYGESFRCYTEAKSYNVYSLVAQKTGFVEAKQIYDFINGRFPIYDERNTHVPIFTAGELYALHLTDNPFLYNAVLDDTLD